MGQLTLARIWGGTLKENSEVFNATKEQKERLGTVYFIHGKKNDPAPEAQAGDIVALAKLKATQELELGSEIVRGQLERVVDVKVGDDLNKIMGSEILLEDGKVLAFRS